MSEFEVMLHGLRHSKNKCAVVNTKRVVTVTLSSTTKAKETVEKCKFS